MMWKPGWMACLCLVSALAGLMQHWQKASAAIPNPCPQWQCKNITYLWDGTQLNQGGQQVGIIKLFANANQPAPPQSLTTQGFQSIFASAPSTSQLPFNNLQRKIDIWYYKSCAPNCGQDPNNVWQCPQEVSPVGVALLWQAGANQVWCKNSKLVGPQVNPPVNNNPNKLVPPGN